MPGRTKSLFFLVAPTTAPFAEVDVSEWDTITVHALASGISLNVGTLNPAGTGLRDLRSMAGVTGAVSANECISLSAGLPSKLYFKGNIIQAPFHVHLHKRIS